MSLQWFVAKTKLKKEQALQAWLGKAGLLAYNPEILVVRRGRKRVEPLFPTYLFVRLDPVSSLWPQVRWARGLSYILGSSGQPLPVDDGLVGEIQERVARWNNGGWTRAFTPGQRVVISSGPFRGLEAIFQRYVPARERCLVLISLLGRPLTVPVAITEVESIALRPQPTGATGSGG